MSLTNRARASILDKPLSKGKGEISLSCFALLFSEVVQYCQNKSHTVPELQNRYCNCWFYCKFATILLLFRLHSLGRNVGVKLIDLYFVRERNGKRETKLLNILLFIKSTLWKVIFVLEQQLMCVVLKLFSFSRRYLAEKQTNLSIPMMMKAPIT